MATPIRIDSPADPRIEPYASLRERDLAGRENLFVAEGKVVVRLLLAGRFEAESLLVLENRLAGMVQVVASAPPDLPVYVAPQEVMDAIVGFHIHRGVLALGRRRPAPDAAALLDALPARATVVVPVGITNHHNIGAIFRNAAAFGADAVLPDLTCCDPLYRKAIRVSVGAALKVPFAASASAESLAGLLADRGFACLALSPSGARELRETARPPRLALFLGSEGPGLPAPLLARLDTVRISMAAGFDSLNVATAAAIALHHFSG